MMKTNQKILFLALNIFDSTGGIQKVCRTIAKVVNDLPNRNNQVLSLFDNLPDSNYTTPVKFRGFNGKRLRFTMRSILAGRKTSTVIISHVHLVAISVLIKLLNTQSRIIMIAHGTEVWRSLPVWKKWFIRKYMTVWTVSDYTKNRLHNLHRITRNVKTIHNSLDPFFEIPSSFQKPGYLLKKYNLNPDQPVLLTICRQNKHEHDKGYNEVIKTIPRLLEDFPNLRYLLCGAIDDVEKGRIMRIVIKNKLQQYISLTGFIDQRELTDHYLLADSFILPSKKEGFGLVFIEAAACGCQIISGNADGSAEALLQGKLGTMVNPSNLEELYKSIHGTLLQKQTLKDKKNLQRLILQSFGFSSYQNKIKAALST
ncbi:MAG: glycosyltransferase family 4 protein [Bacteroidota bacterium]